MQPVRVNVAVLSIADGTAPESVGIENVVADRLTDAGHQIAAFEAVRDSETAIRAQLVGWLADPDVDVVIVVGDGEQITGALKPMIDLPLPGFADLLRNLAFHEIGSSAMLSAAEAARCGTTFVFVLPGNEKAVKAAMEKLILPQLDPRTKPRNLIGSMPRLRDAVQHDITKVDIAKLGAVPADVTRVDTARTESARVASTKQDVTHTSVPTPVPVEKTATGAGVQPKLPAGRAQPVPVQAQGPRPRSRTGVNVIVRKVEDPTKPIELVELEEQIALSKDDGPAATPAPAAPAAAAARPNIATRPLDVSNLRAPATPNAIAKPLPSITGRKPAASTRPPAAAPAPRPVDDHTRVDHHTNPDLLIGDATKPLELTKPTTDATAKPARTSRPRVADVGESTKPLDLGKLPKVPPGANKEDIDNQETGEIIALPPKPAAAPTPTPIARVQPKAASMSSSPPPKAASTPPPKATPSVPVPVVSPPASARVRQPTPPIPTHVILNKPKPKPAPAPTPELEPEPVETLDLEPDAEVAPAVPAAAEPAASATAAPTPSAAVPAKAPDPAAPVEDQDPEVASSSFLAPTPARRKPTAPPPSINDLITTAPSTSLNELPRGAFEYPTKRKSKVPLVIALLLLSAAIGGGAMWFFNRDKGKPEASVAQPAVATDAAVAAVEPVTIDAAEVAAVEPDATEPEIMMTPDAAEVVASSVPKPTKPTRPTTTTRPTPTERPVTRPDPALETEKPAPPDKPAGPVAEPGCEEVTCVLEKYARPCCARFKPQGNSFVPSAGDGETLAKPQIKAGVDKMKPRVIACGEQHKANGTVKLAISVDGDGNVTDVSVQSAPDDALGACVEGVMRKAKFAKTANGGSFTYPFVF